MNGQVYHRTTYGYFRAIRVHTTYMRVEQSNSGKCDLMYRFFDRARRWQS